jgi:hypothetical protein
MEPKQAKEAVEVPSAVRKGECNIDATHEKKATWPKVST